MLSEGQVCFKERSDSSNIFPIVIEEISLLRNFRFTVKVLNYTSGWTENPSTNLRVGMGVRKCEVIMLLYAL